MSVVLFMSTFNVVPIVAMLFCNICLHPSDDDTLIKVMYLLQAGVCSSYYMDAFFTPPPPQHNEQEKKVGFVTFNSFRFLCTQNITLPQQIYMITGVITVYVNSSEIHRNALHQTIDKSVNFLPCLVINPTPSLVTTHC